jgi:hypothetical protein
MGYLVIILVKLATIHHIYNCNYEPYLTPFGWVLVQQYPNLSNKSPFLLMQSPTQYIMSKTPLFNLNTGSVSAIHEQYLK